MSDSKINTGMELPVLEIKCDYCDGMGGNLDRGWSRCPCCEGGYVPTDAGKQILKLLRHNFLSMERELSEEEHSSH